jgi:hypothetical protein
MIEDLLIKLNSFPNISITSYKQEEEKEKTIIEGFYKEKKFLIILYRNSYILKVIEKTGESKTIEGKLNIISIVRDLKMLGSGF